ncbi:hypothetical protein Y694_02077 [Methylibium sp. T29-B]|nr:hypothetical protein Y694_02077 [Methylibium sp. T29-B]
MQSISSSVPAAALAGGALAATAVSRAAPGSSAYAGYQIIRRNGAVVAFEPNKIAVA